MTQSQTKGVRDWVIERPWCGHCRDYGAPPGFRIAMVKPERVTALVSQIGDAIAPDGYTLKSAMIARPGNMDIQLDLFLNSESNVKLYPAFQGYFRNSQLPLLAIWGKKDPFFLLAGAEVYRRDNSNATVQLLGTGHFASETHVEETAASMLRFLALV
jgi:pimeloyl-ACP methyl ester carboxylesterase